MKSKFLFGAAVVISAVAIAWGAKDPVVMTINGEDVPQSEFEYLYNKNSQQQIEELPIEEYVSMFELYKMKVADAKAEGIDTTETFLSEMAQYRRDLANPYLTDSIYLEKLIDEAYNNSLEELDYYHIMIPKGRNRAENNHNLQLADSLRSLLLEGEDFEVLAKRYSCDPSVAVNGGHLGYVAGGKLPYHFEHEAYLLKPEEISKVVESNAGYHIIKVGNRRPAKGSVRASHIMKSVRPGSAPAIEIKAKADIDSLYAFILANPSLFEKVAQSNSDDKGSARVGGQLGWFTTGMMVPEFQEKVFDMEVGTISEPVRTPYGWHIIKKTGAENVKSREQLKQELLPVLNDARDERYKMVRDNRDVKLSKKHKASLNEKTLTSLRNYVETQGLDSAFYSTYGDSEEILYSINGINTPVAVFVGSLNGVIRNDPYMGSILFEERLKKAYDEALISAEEDWLYANEEDYRNLLNEYRDGSLLYEVSLRKVWDKAANDTAGLERYFEGHKSEYKFKEPRAKGILILAKNDSVADLVKARYAELGKDTALQTLRSEFRQDIVADRLLAPKGLNRFVDAVLFEETEPELNPKFPVYFILDARVVDEPEEMNDVKGAVTTDYQQLLEQNWTTELRRKYPVNRNEPVLKKLIAKKHK